MMRSPRVLITIVLIAFIGLGFSWSPAPTSAQDSPQFDLPGCTGTFLECADYWINMSDEGLSCAAKIFAMGRNGKAACQDAYHARGWALTNTFKLFGTTPDGSMGNAFGHCIWIGAIATWNGFDVAVAVGENHEISVPNGEGLRQMDLANNTVGARVGDDAAVAKMEDMWGYVMTTCEAWARNGVLYGPCGVQGAYVPDDYAQDPNTITCSGGGGGGGGW